MSGLWATGPSFNEAGASLREDARVSGASRVSSSSKDQASLAKRDSASTISGIRGVGEKPLSAGARTARASAGRFKDWWSLASDNAARKTKLRARCCRATSMALRNSPSAASQSAASRLKSISPRARRNSASNARYPVFSQAASASSTIAMARSGSLASNSASASAIFNSPSKGAILRSRRSSAPGACSRLRRPGCRCQGSRSLREKGQTPGTRAGRAPA
jgi:hypothetical protein